MKYLKKENLYLFFMLSALALALGKICVHLEFFLLPLLFLGLGLASYLWKQEKALTLFFFLLPLVNALPDLFFNGYPYNYMAVALFYLAGMILAALVRREALDFQFKWAGPYLFFLTLLWLSVLFLVLRWSNITLPALATGADTPVTPSGERTSFATIFPVVTLFLFSVTPFLPVLIKKHRLEEKKVFMAILAGYSLSLVTALVQKFLDPGFLAIEWWGEKLNQYNGTFSDFNAFGFFSGLLFLYLVVSFINNGARGKERWLQAGGMLLTLGGIMLSGCRTAFLFVLFALGFLAFTKKIKLVYKAAALLLVLVLLAAAGGTLKKRLLLMTDNIKQVGKSGDIITALDKVTNGRIEMMQRSVPLLKKYPLAGVGGGNFLFYLKYQFLGQEYWEDLPLNHYLLILDETGIPGLLVFIYFLVALVRQKRKQKFNILLAAVLTALFFNFFLWFPEIFLLFWITASFTGEGDREKPLIARKWPVPAAAGLLLVFVAANLFYFNALHPKTWVREKGVDYDYGFWYLEKTPQGVPYQWSKAKAGVILFLDGAGRSRPLKIVCGAPLDKLADRTQVVEVLWKGKLYRKESFKENGEVTFQVEGEPGEEGFLELRVHPTFNLKKLGISPEPRDLGVQFFISRDQ